MRRQIEDLEEEACRERSKCRQLQRSIDDLNEANETLTRENAQLKSLAALARRSGLNRASTSRFGSKHTFYFIGIADSNKVLENLGMIIFFCCRNILTC